jgi:hypothetical protein
MANVKFTNNSIKVKEEINETTIAWLHDWANTIASNAKANTKLDGEAGIALRKDYKALVNDGKGEAMIGSSLEAAFWEEFGTGSHAVNGDGRPGWWVYKDGYQGNGGKQLTEAQAKAIAAGDPTVHATNGREPAKTLETAFTVNKPKAIKDLDARLGRMSK